MNPTYLLPCLLAILSPSLLADEVTVGADDTVIKSSCTVQISAESIPDTNGDGVVHVQGKGIVVDFTGAHLHGAAPGATPDTFAGTGVRVTGKNVTIRGLQVSGYKIGIDAEGVDGLVVEGCDVSDNFAQRLHSTPEEESGKDWLAPQYNDDLEWTRHYGAGIHVRNANDITVKDCRARHTQNGLILDRVNNSRVFDNDMSFLSGWGLAMWRSSNNVISRNQFDFCVRGYSHGVYNRGQDSAGILMFEQCSDNTIAQNSAICCGDGFFGFAGHEALGEFPIEGFDYTRRGNNDNILVLNDFSHAAAHGIELTFSFGNLILDNRLWNNGICGIWAGYSKGTRIHRNQIGRNGSMAYGLERGGVNIEHGKNNLISHNLFVENKCGVHLWWDSDEDLVSLPWALANGHESKNNQILLNEFRRDELAIQLRNTLTTTVNGNDFKDVGVVIEADDPKHVIQGSIKIPPPPTPEYAVFGKKKPQLRREYLGGRAAIFMTEWGPYDYEAPRLQRLADAGGDHLYRVLGPAGDLLVEASATGPVKVVVQPMGKAPAVIHVTPDEGTSYGTYLLTAKIKGGSTQTRTGSFLRTTWNAKVFAYQTDPREDLDQWHVEAEKGTPCTLSELDLRFGGRGPSELEVLGADVAAAGIEGNRFGIIAETTVKLPAGKWKLETRSDDGIRLWVDGEQVVDDWTHHGPTSHDADLSFAAAGEHRIRVEYFELDGHAELVVNLLAGS